MDRSPNEERSALVNMIIDRLGGADRIVLDKFDAEAGTILLRIWPDHTKQDDCHRFLVSVKHQLPA